MVLFGEACRISHSVLNGFTQCSIPILRGVFGCCLVKHAESHTQCSKDTIDDDHFKRLMIMYTLDFQ